MLFDRATTHITSEIIDYLHLLNIKYVLIPSGFTRFLQPLDVGINKLFKIKFIEEIWTVENIIKKQTIINSFLHCGISQLLDGSQDELFKWPD